MLNEKGANELINVQVYFRKSDIYGEEQKSISVKWGRFLIWVPVVTSYCARQVFKVIETSLHKSPNPGSTTCHLYLLISRYSVFKLPYIIQHAKELTYRYLNPLL